MANNEVIRVGVCTFVRRNGKFLMMRRRGSHGADTWGPPGGHLEFGESFEAASVREVDEETGMRIRNIRFGAALNDIFPDGKHYVTIWMLADWAAGEPFIREPAKCTAMEWCSFDELPAPLFFPWQQLLGSPFVESIRQQLL